MQNNQSMSEIYANRLIAENNDPVNFLNYLKSKGPCLDYGSTPEGLLESVKDISGPPRRRPFERKR